jgi:5-methylcytosine-specific restriction endonuclease McrA
MAKAKDARITRAYKKLRISVLESMGYTCVYCGQDADQVDHVVPITKDPSLGMEVSNLVACCRRCNISKGNRSEAVFLRRTATPTVLPSNTSLKTTGTVQAGPALGQPRQN